MNHTITRCNIILLCYIYIKHKNITLHIKVLLGSYPKDFYVEFHNSGLLVHDFTTQKHRHIFILISQAAITIINIYIKSFDARFNYYKLEIVKPAIL